MADLDVSSSTLMNDCWIIQIWKHYLTSNLPYWQISKPQLSYLNKYDYWMNRLEYHQLRSKRVLITIRRCFRWEPEGHYHCSKVFPLRTRRVLSLFRDVLLRTRRVLSLFKGVPLRTRRALSLIKGVSVENQTSAIAIALYGDNTFLVLNRTFLI